MEPIFFQGHIVTPGTVLHNHSITIQDGKIKAISPAGDVTWRNDLPYILPGFRDQHVHDLIGQEKARSHAPEALVDCFREATAALGRHGVTRVWIATFGDSLATLERYGQGARLWMDHPANGQAGAQLEGIHIEGTFLNEECRGAQPAEHILIPTRDDCRTALNKLKNTGSVKLVNIVPDYGEESLQVIRYARHLGLTVGAGHLNSSAALLRRAYEESGLQFMIHFTNGPTGQSFKPFGGGGAFEGALQLPIYKELILDLIHVDERYILDIIKQTEDRWGVDKIVAVTDALYANLDNLPRGKFTIGSTLAGVDPTGRYLQTLAYRRPDGTEIPAPPNTLCGSILTMDKAFTNLVNLFTRPCEGHWYRHEPLSLDDALVKAARLCATNQAILVGDDLRAGSIQEGLAADLVIGTIERREHEYALQIGQVMVEGHVIWGSMNH
ncbi:MAG TPA: hypothetical protein PLX83_04100 [bacterium]|nr:hypothetical protein [bacterium]